MYTCREIEKLLDTYTDGELDGPRRLRVEAHLQDCALCSRLARCKEEEARLIRSGDPAPALSAGFTGRVMSNLTHSPSAVFFQAGRSPDTADSRARGEGFFSLRKLLARLWLAPALAGLLLLVTVSWAASRHLLPFNPRQVAFQNSTATGRAAQALPQTPALSGTDNLALKGSLPMFGASEMPAEPGDAQGPAISKGAAGSGDTAGTESNRDNHPSPQENRGAVAGKSPNSGNTPVYKTMEIQTTNPAPPQTTIYKELEQQGYVVFSPSYLPPSYSLVSYSPQPPASGVSSGGSTQDTASHPGQDSLLLTYRNGQTGGWLTLEILPLNSQALQPGTKPFAATGNGSASPAVQPSPATPESSYTPDVTAGPAASANTTGNQPPGTDRITWQDQKNGASFLLTLTGSLPDEELKKVADSVQ